jgi:hypothetical protein
MHSCPLQTVTVAFGVLVSAQGQLLKLKTLLT